MSILFASDAPASSPGRKHSLRVALVLRTLLPLFLVLGTAAGLALLTLEREVERRMEEDVELVARSLRLPIIHAIEREREGTVSEALRSALDIGRVYSAHVYGPEGERLASFGAGVSDDPEDRLSAVAESGEETGEYARAAGRRVYSYRVPLADVWGQSLGVLELTRRRADIDASIRRLRFQAGGLLLLGMILTTILVLRGHHRAVGGPLHRLRASMARVQAGDRDQRAEEEGPHELAEVARTFNAMLASIRGAETQLEARRQAQDALQRELARAEKLAAVGELAGGVAHELGSPLSVIDGKAQRLLRNETSSKIERKSHQEIRDEVRRMEAIIRQLLEFGRQDTGRSRRVRLGDVVIGGVTAASEEAERREVDIHTDGPEPGPTVHADRRRLEGAVANLVRNACQAADRGGIEARVDVRWRAEHGWAVVEVEDDGPGMPDDVRLRAFEPFFTTKATGEGTGLGLAVVHGVAESHGGTVEIDRGRLGGARFRLRLPCPEEELGRTHE